MIDILSPVIRTDINPRQIRLIRDITLKYFLSNILKIINEVRNRYRYFVINIPITGLFLKGQ